VDKSGICASARTIASQWLTIIVRIRIKAQIAHRCRVVDRRHSLLWGEVVDITVFPNASLIRNNIRSKE
jgi:hypothetical protein